MPSAEHHNGTSDVHAERRSLVQCARALPSALVTGGMHNRLLSVVLLGGTAIIATSLASVGYHLLTHRVPADRPVSISTAMELLEKGDYDAARLIAQQLQEAISDEYQPSGASFYVQGSILTKEAAELLPGEKRRTIYLIAAHYLEQARDRGFPPGHEQEGLYLLAVSLFQAGMFAQSLPALQEAFETLPDARHEIARLMSTAYFNDTPPNLQQALHFNKIWLETPELDGTAREQALLQLAEIHLHRGDAPACRDAFAQFDQNSACYDRVLLIEAQLDMKPARQLIDREGETSEAKRLATEQYRRAIAALEQAASKDPMGTTSGPARYLIGVCHQRMGDLPAAQHAFELVRRTHYGTPEALAATLAEAEIEQQQGHDKIALQLLLNVTESTGESTHYRNRWVSLNDLQGRLEKAHRQFLQTAQFPAALSMVGAFELIIPDDEVMAANATTHETWAEHLLELADTQGHSARIKSQADARRHFRQAGDAYEKLARLRFATDKFPDDLWKSGSCFLRGQNFDQAVRLLREHLIHVPRRQAPPGLVSLGECHLTLGQYQTALSLLNECIDYFPKHPQSYRAAILASAAYRETGKLNEAKTLLINNLHNSALTPQSHYWQESLLRYGELLFQEASTRETESQKMWVGELTLEQRQSHLKALQEAHDLYLESIRSLEEVVARSEPDQAPGEAQYLIAEGYKHAAIFPAKSLEVEPTQTRRFALRQQMRDYLQNAAQTHRQLQLQWARKQNSTELSRVEEKLLRNTYFAYADTLFSLGEYEQAINAYTAATNHCQHDPEALEALLQIASCYRRLDAPAEARGTLLQAESVLARLRQDVDFAKTTRCSRDQWTELIGWLSQL